MSCLIRRCALFLLLCTTLGAVENVQPNKPLPTDRKSVRVESIPDALAPNQRLKVLRTDAGSPLRAGTAWVWSQEPMEQPASYYTAMRECGLNAVRLICFDVWIHDQGQDPQHKLAWSSADYRTAMLARLIRAVDHCSAAGLYAIITYHGNVKAYDLNYAKEFWSVIAPTFRNRPHVLFETQNEPLGGAGEHAGADDLPMLAKLRTIHDLVRHAAPESHIMILTPCGVSAYGAVDGMKRLVDRFAGLAGTPLDWQRTSVAYHLYHADTNLYPKAEDLRTLHASYPAWPSENSFPKRFTCQQLGAQEGDNERSVAYGTDEFVLQTCERLGLGWSQWHIDGKRLKTNWQFLWADAIKKGYAWKPDQLKRPGSKP